MSAWSSESNDCFARGLPIESEKVVQMLKSALKRVSKITETDRLIWARSRAYCWAVVCFIKINEVTKTLKRAEKGEYYATRRSGLRSVEDQQGSPGVLGVRDI